MHYTPVTPFRRAMDAARIAELQSPPAPESGGIAPVDKWQVLRDVTTCRAELGLSDREMRVLQALLSFHPETELSLSSGSLIIFPSNAAICARLNGMPDSTMRRHLSRLINAGLLRRCDSPNGKRYRRRSMATEIRFGFDLAPLVHRAAEFDAAAEQARAAVAALNTLREAVSLMRRDLQSLVAWGMSEQPQHAAWHRLQDLITLTARDLRRRPNRHFLNKLAETFTAALDEVKSLLGLGKTVEMSSNVVQNEQHLQKSDKEYLDSEDELRTCKTSLAQEQAKTTARIRAPDTELCEVAPHPTVPLPMVLSHCKELQAYASEPVTTWQGLIRLCDTLRPMIGITVETWQSAKSNLTPQGAAIVLATMFERLPQIRSPGAYLRHLSQKAMQSGLSLLSMVKPARRAGGYLSSQL